MVISGFTEDRLRQGCRQEFLYCGGCEHFNPGPRPHRETGDTGCGPCSGGCPWSCGARPGSGDPGPSGGPRSRSAQSPGQLWAPCGRGDITVGNLASPKTLAHSPPPPSEPGVRTSAPPPTEPRVWTSAPPVDTHRNHCHVSLVFVTSGPTKPFTLPSTMLQDLLASPGGALGELVGTASWHSRCDRGQPG